jgi:probable HAF family extracellular repeat protein
LGQIRSILDASKGDKLAAAQTHAMEVSMRAINAFGLLLIASALATCGPISYRAIPLPTVGTFSGYNAVNGNGQATGFFFPETGTDLWRAFLYDGGKVKDLGKLAARGDASEGEGINDRGQVVGWSNVSANTTHAFVYESGHMMDLGTLGGSVSVASDINNRGQITGWSDTSGDKTLNAFLYQNGHMTSLGTLGGVASSGSAINNTGQITGDVTYPRPDHLVDHAFFYTNGNVMDLGTLGGAESEGVDINDRGQVTGWANVSENSDAAHAFLYSNGHMNDLGTLGGSQSWGVGVDNAGHVVGYSYLNGDIGQGAFLYADGTMHDLNDLVSSGLRQGASLGTVWGISSQGWIIASSGLDDYLLEPVPEPEAVGLLAFGLIACACLRFRRT